MANASNAVAICAVQANRAEPRAAGRPLVAQTLVAAAGGLVGALLLHSTGADAFSALVPWLLLAATPLIALGPKLAAATEDLRFDRPFVTGGVEFLVAVRADNSGRGQASF
ncbi:hypothetical protein [Jannaschia donghaensis]|uniref:Uncharacterized protein n=1 Tax=Jannaschia donghaensis TaxID=420998 RepID=A0A0M6YMP3_9RHOB|nr:hypothetical protein [Jannaschia donghaensis]CTQ50527.1 hypothetical protein JDO7802_02551 [Jannaschia donghaensis]